MADLPDIARTEIAIVELTNAFRRSQRLSDVRPNTELTQAAKLYAAYLAKSGRFAHEADGRQPADRVKASGYKFCIVSENLASNLDSRGFTSRALAEQAVEGWKNSPGHRKNMVEPDVTEIGTGVAQAPTADPKFISVQLFGRPESLKYQFRVENRAGASVTYSALGAAHTIEPKVIATHTACKPGEVVFERAGNFLTGTKLSSRFAARDGVTFSIITGDDGRVRIEAAQPPAQPGPSSVKAPVQAGPPAPPKR
ncbi:MAG: CAP domain-containing protein [Hyphomicrobiaceae bacterium]